MRLPLHVFCLLGASSSKCKAPNVDNEVQWITGLRQRVGEKQFTTLYAQVEPRAEPIVEKALQRGVE